MSKKKKRKEKEKEERVRPAADAAHWSRSSKDELLAGTKCSPNITRPAQSAFIITIIATRVTSKCYFSRRKAPAKAFAGSPRHVSFCLSLSLPFGKWGLSLHLRAFELQIRLCNCFLVFNPCREGHGAAHKKKRGKKKLGDQRPGPLVQGGVGVAARLFRRSQTSGVSRRQPDTHTQAGTLLCTRSARQAHRRCGLVYFGCGCWCPAGT